MKAKQKRDEFKVRLSGIEIGNHKYSIFCDKEFFELAEITEVLEGSLSVDVEMRKEETMVQFSFHFYGNLTLPCDRCLDSVILPLDFTESLIVKYSALGETNFEDEMIWIIPENEYELDIFHFVYESIVLALPHKIAHPENEDGESGCNPEFLEKIEKLSVKESGNDPRWDALRNIKIDDN